MAITAFAALLDLGFSPSFTRNVTYIFSGIKPAVTGFHSEDTDDKTVDYGLLKGIIVAMQWFYMRMALILFLLLSTVGTYYIYSLLKNYKGSKPKFILHGLGCAVSPPTIFTHNI